MTTKKLIDEKLNYKVFSLSLIIIFTIYIFYRPYWNVFYGSETDYIFSALHIINWGEPIIHVHPGTLLYYFTASLIKFFQLENISLKYAVVILRLIFLYSSILLIWLFCNYYKPTHFKKLNFWKTLCWMLLIPCLCIWCVNLSPFLPLFAISYITWSLIIDAINKNEIKYKELIIISILIGLAISIYKSSLLIIGLFYLSIFFIYHKILLNFLKKITISLIVVFFVYFLCTITITPKNFLTLFDNPIINIFFSWYYAIKNFIIMNFTINNDLISKINLVIEKLIMTNLVFLLLIIFILIYLIHQKKIYKYFNPLKFKTIIWLKYLALFSFILPLYFKIFPNFNYEIFKLNEARFDEYFIGSIQSFRILIPVIPLFLLLNFSELTILKFTKNGNFKIILIIFFLILNISVFLKLEKINENYLDNLILNESNKNVEKIFLYPEENFSSKIKFILWGNYRYGNTMTIVPDRWIKNYKKQIEKTRILKIREHLFLKSMHDYNLYITPSNIKDYGEKGNIFSNISHNYPQLTDIPKNICPDFEIKNSNMYNLLIIDTKKEPNDTRNLSILKKKIYNLIYECSFKVISEEKLNDRFILIFFKNI